MTRPALKLAPPAKPAIPYSLLRKAVALYRSDMVPRSVRRANARKWLAAMTQLGNKHVHKGGSANWSHPQILNRSK